MVCADAVVATINMSELFRRMSWPFRNSGVYLVDARSVDLLIPVRRRSGTAASRGVIREQNDSFAIQSLDCVSLGPGTLMTILPLTLTNNSPRRTRTLPSEHYRF